MGHKSVRLCISILASQSEITEAADSRGGFAYVLVMVEDISKYLWLRPARACTANLIAVELVSWCSDL